MVIILPRILVTGGLGFIGSHLIKRLLIGENGYSVYNIDNESYGSNHRNLQGLETHKSYSYLKGDINDVNRISDLPKTDTIINVASETHVDRSISNPRGFLHSNFQGTFELLEFARKNDVTKYVQVSTDEVYGEAPAGREFKESDPVNPSNPYSAAKAAADLLVKSYSRTYGLNAVITRCSNNFGSNQFPEKLIPKTIISIITGSPIYVYGDGLQVRDWIFVENHVDALLSVMEKGQSGEIYNVSTQNLMTNLDMISRVQTLVKNRTGKEGRIMFVKDRPGHDRRYSINSEKLERHLGWKQTVAFEEALSRTVEWYLGNEKWWRPLLDQKIMHPQPWEASWNTGEQK